MVSDTIEKLSRLYESWCGVSPVSVMKLPGSGSYRSYYRILGQKEPVIGVHNDDIRENIAFVSFTSHFLQSGIPVPRILAEQMENRIYLLSDLGDQTLYQLLTERRSTEEPFPDEVLSIYKEVIRWLPVFQVKAGRHLDYSVCYPRAAFDHQSMMWDLNYFKYYFLKLAKIPFDEQALEDDFIRLTRFLMEADNDYFLFRDFQSRNIMVQQGKPWFIDYQGGRKGALQYDIASLLTDGKADIPVQVRAELLECYLDELGKVIPVDRNHFIRHYHGFALIRILQALGAYGFRGYYENKPHFLRSIPFALRNLRYMREHHEIGFGLNCLMQVIDRMVDMPSFYQASTGKSKLTVTIHSFSYRKSIPADETDNGGGFVFDCRTLPNPGRFDEYKLLTGKDQAVADFLRKETEVDEFIHHAFALVDQSIQKYSDRGFEHLMVSFGCTGGQHRSVYCAEELARYLRERDQVAIKLTHDEQINHSL